MSQRISSQRSTCRVKIKSTEKKIRKRRELFFSPFYLIFLFINFFSTLHIEHLPFIIPSYPFFDSREVESSIDVLQTFRKFSKDHHRREIAQRHQFTIMAAVTCYLIRIVRKIFVTFPFDDDLHDGNKFHSLIPSSKCIPQTYIFRHMLPIDENVDKTIKHNLEGTTR